MMAAMNKQTCVQQPPAVNNNHAGVYFDASMRDPLSWPPITRPSVGPATETSRPLPMAQSARPPTGLSGKQLAKKPAVTQNVRFSTPTHRSNSKAKWSDRVEAEENVGDYTSSTSSDHRDVDEDGFEIHESPKRKKTA